MTAVEFGSCRAIASKTGSFGSEDAILSPGTKEIFLADKKRLVDVTNGDEGEGI